MLHRIFGAKFAWLSMISIVVSHTLLTVREDEFMSQFHVNSEVMMASTGALRSTVGQMQGLMSTMQTQLETLAGSWTGAAASAFQDLVAEWQVTQRAVEGNLEEISVALSTANDFYTDVESNNLRLFAR